jgi:signal peptidase I
MNKYLKALIWILIVAAVAIAIGWFFFYAETVPDHSMAPTMWGGDRILVLKRGKLNKGDVAVCEHPEFPDQLIMGRIVGMSGDAIEITRGQLHVNGNIMHEEIEGPFLYMDRKSSTEAFEFKLTRKMQIVHGIIAYLLYDENPVLKDAPKTVVQSGYYLLADNRAGGMDSRTYGEVHESLCHGRAFFIYQTVKGIGDADEIRRAFTFVNNPPHKK